MDAGSFIYESDGVRWAIDLGMHDYNILEQAGVDLWNMKQESPRWEIFRIGAESHNTLTFNGHRHAVDGMAEIGYHYDNQRTKGVTINLTDVFSADAQSVERTAELDKNDRLTITDHIVNGPQASTAAWNMATNAEAQIVDDNTILLRQDGKQLYLKLRTKADAKAIDFDDSFIYDELELKPEERHLPSEQLMHDEAFKVFEQWRDMEDKVKY